MMNIHDILSDIHAMEEESLEFEPPLFRLSVSIVIAYLGVINYLIMKRKLKKFQKIEKPVKISDE